MAQYYDFFESRPAIAVKGGIKAQTRRGQFGQSWWAKRWLAVLESFNLGARLARGKSYARQGQVASIDIAKGMVTASVQGSQRTPYRVSISVDTLSAENWKQVADILNEQVIFAAQLLGGEMPDQIEEVFQKAGVSLFPAKHRELKTSCSCPDYSNPCKHIAAVYYLLGEEFDRNPSLIFQLRGITMKELTAMLTVDATEMDDAAHKLPDEPLSSDIRLFWQGSSAGLDLVADIQTPTVVAALPKQLGGFPFWRETVPFQDAMAAIYAAASPRGVEVAEGGLQREGLSLFGVA